MPRLDPESLPAHVDRLYRAAWALCGSPHDAEDLVQETFARVLSRPRLLRGDDELAYLMRVLRNTFLQLAPDGVAPPAGRGPRRGARAPRPRARASSPEQALEAQAVYGAIAELPEDFRLALVAVDIARPLLRRGGARARCARGDDHLAPAPRAPPRRRGRWTLSSSRPDGGREGSDPPRSLD